MCEIGLDGYVVERPLARPRFRTLPSTNEDRMRVALWSWHLATEAHRRARHPRGVGDPFGWMSRGTSLVEAFDIQVNVLIGRRIKTERVFAGLRQVDIATAIGLPRSTFARIERGERPISVAELLRVSVQLRRPVALFFEPPPKEIRSRWRREYRAPNFGWQPRNVKAPIITKQMMRDVARGRVTWDELFDE